MSPFFILHGWIPSGQTSYINTGKRETEKGREEGWEGRGKGGRWAGEKEGRKGDRAETLRGLSENCLSSLLLLYKPLQDFEAQKPELLVMALES